MAPLGYVLAAQLAAASPSDTETPTPVPPSYSLASWAERVWNQMSDRGGSIFGRLAEEGIFQRYHPLQDTEYRLDELASGFALGEETRWHAADNGFRAWGGSISNRNFINAAEAKLSLPVASRLDFGFHLWQEESLEAQRRRILFTLSYDSLLAGWRAWAGITLEFMKPDADLELGLGRELGDRWKLSLALSVLDAFNDYIFGTLGVDSAETDVFREYRRQPIAVRSALEWKPARAWRLELFGATTNRAHLDGDLVADSLAGFEQRERSRFVGALVEWAPAAPLAVGGFARTAEAETSRGYTPADSVRDFQLLERTSGAGLYALFRPSPGWDIEAALAYTGRRERRRGDDPVDLRDREWSAWLSLWRRVAGWLYLSAGYFYDDRALTGSPLLAGTLGRTNQRVRTDFEIRFPRGARLGAGVNWDFDFPANQSFFDGAHGRLAVTF